MYINTSHNNDVPPLLIQATNDIYIGLRSGYKKLQNRKVPFNMKGYNS